MRYLSLFVLLLLHVLVCPAQHTLLWRISKPGSTHVSYLFGTMHQVGNSFIDSLPAVKDKLTGADLAIFESITDPKDIARMLNSRQPSNEIEAILSQKDLDILRNLSKNWAVDFHKVSPAELLVKLQQEYITTKCGTVLPTDQWNHMDQYLMNIARSHNIVIKGFESDSAQLRAINAGMGGSWKDMKKPIVKCLRKHQEPADEGICADCHSYMRFDVDYSLDKSCVEGPMLKARNDEWMKQLPTLLDAHNCFIAVGLLHLGRQCGLIMQLRALGYSVEEQPLPASLRHGGQAKGK